MGDIIGSMVIDGHFYYLPSLPFVENKLAPERYKIEWERIIGDRLVNKVTKIAG
jgi:hypothetical protein